VTTDHRVGPPSSGSERDMLRSFLDDQCATLAMKCDGHADFLREGIDGTVGA
jgi:hypothetical protein